MAWGWESEGWVEMGGWDGEVDELRVHDKFNSTLKP